MRTTALDSSPDTHALEHVLVISFLLSDLTVFKLFLLLSVLHLLPETTFKAIYFSLLIKTSNGSFTSYKHSTFLFQPLSPLFAPLPPSCPMLHHVEFLNYLFICSGYCPVCMEENSFTPVFGKSHNSLRIQLKYSPVKGSFSYSLGRAG